MEFSFASFPRDYQLLQLVAAGVGTATILSTLLRFSRFTWSYFLRSSNLHVYLHTQQNEGGSWALITGASDGIGYAFVEELLTKGFNVLLHGRNGEKLNRIQNELKARFPDRSIEIVVADASAPGHPEDLVVAKAKTIPGKLTILINNVGGNATRPGCSPLADFPREHVDTCINLNARFPLLLTRALIPVLERSSPALIINCGSGAARGIPYLATYSATKGFIHSFTTALRNEFTRSDAPGSVDVIGFVIGNVMSASNRIALPAVTISAAQCARGCLERVGCGEAVTCAHWKHASAMWFVSLLPSFYSRTTVIFKRRSQHARSCIVKMRSSRRQPRDLTPFLSSPNNNHDLKERPYKKRTPATKNRKISEPHGSASCNLARRR